LIDEIVRQVLQGLLVSPVYSLGALAITISYSVTRIANFATGEYVMLGAYSAALLTISGLDPFSSLAVSGILVGGLAILIDETFYKPLQRRGSTPLQLLIASLGVMLLLRYLWSIYADYEDILFLTSRFRIEALAYLSSAPLTNLHIVSISIVALVSLFLYILRHRTMVGKAMRGLASNPELASISGIPVWRVRRLTWLVAGFLAGICGGLWAFYTSITTETGFRLLLWFFSASIIGGISSIPLTVAGGFIIGFSENLGMWFFNRFFSVDPAYRPLIPYAVIVISLLARRLRR
jgi:branched-subunit amino acid ABC-type transport system permease component